MIISILTGLIIESTDSLITILRTHRKPEIQLFRLYIRTEAKCMTMAQEEKIRINYPEVPTTKYDDRATHVVTEIEYGVDFTFTFSKQEDEGIKDETFKDRLLTLGVGGSWALRWKEIFGQFKRDFEISPDGIMPSTFREAFDSVPAFNTVVQEMLKRSVYDESLCVPHLVSLEPLGGYILYWIQLLLFNLLFN